MGELNEQQIKTPDYTAHITSFDLNDLEELCDYIKDEPDLKGIPYLWIDAISVDQYDKVGKQETILKMNQIYKNASYILAVPDLHWHYLWKNTANIEIMKLLNKYKELIHEDIFNINNSTTNPTHDIKNSVTNSTQQHTTNNNYNSVIQKSANKLLIKENEELRNENKELKMKMKENENNELKKAYQFLSFLIDDWSNRAWVISEYYIAKEIYISHGTPLKYMFISLLQLDKPFFSYYFDDDDDDDRQQYTTLKNSNILYCENVDGPKTFNQFIRTRFMKRSHLDMILNSNANRNEDRFNAILPSWNKYKHHIKNKNTVSDWNITDMISVRLKLYEMLNDGDLWDKAKLLHACSKSCNKIILPTFASHYELFCFELIEIDNINNAYKHYVYRLLASIQNEEEKDRIKQLIIEYKMNSKPIWVENLTSIRLVYHHHYLSVKSNTYFIYEVDELDKKNILSDNPLLIEYGNCLHYVYIPFFTYTIPDYTDVPPFEHGTYIQLIGNIDKNKWVLTYNISELHFTSERICSNDYTFNIY